MTILIIVFLLIVLYVLPGLGLLLLLRYFYKNDKYIKDKNLSLDDSLDDDIGYAFIPVINLILLIGMGSDELTKPLRKYVRTELIKPFRKYIKEFILKAKKID